MFSSVNILIVFILTVVTFYNSDARLYCSHYRLAIEIKKAITALKNDLMASQIQLVTKTCGPQSKPQPPKPPVSGKKIGRDCADLYKKGITKSGVYQIRPFQSASKTHKPVLAYCDMTTDGGGWTVFQRRQDGKTDFYRNWAAYKKGFGNPKGEHWLGNDNIHALTQHLPSELRVDLESWDGEEPYAKYGVFSLGSSKTRYRLQVSRYSGTAGDSLKDINGKRFSTYDNVNSLHKPCATEFHGAWWYWNCGPSNLNGRYYHTDRVNNLDGITWYHWKKKWYYFKRSEMKVRPKSFNH